MPWWALPSANDFSAPQSGKAWVGSACQVGAGSANEVHCHFRCRDPPTVGTIRGHVFAESVCKENPAPDLQRSVWSSPLDTTNPPPTYCRCMLFVPQLQFAREWCRKGEPTLAAFAFQKASKAFEREKDVRRFQFRIEIHSNLDRGTIYASELQFRSAMPSRNLIRGTTCIFSDAKRHQKHGGHLCASYPSAARVPGIIARQVAIFRSTTYVTSLYRSLPSE